MPWLSCDLAVTELWPLLAVTEPWSLGPGAMTTVLTVSSPWPFIFSWVDTIWQCLLQMGHCSISLKTKRENLDITLNTSHCSLWFLLFHISPGDKTLDMLLGGGKIKQQGGIVTSMLQFSAQTTSWRTQLALTHKLIKKGREAMGAPKGKKVSGFAVKMGCLVIPFAIKIKMKTFFFLQKCHWRFLQIGSHLVFSGVGLYGWLEHAGPRTVWSTATSGAPPTVPRPEWLLWHQEADLEGLFNWRNHISCSCLELFWRNVNMSCGSTSQVVWCLVCKEHVFYCVRGPGLQSALLLGTVVHRTSVFQLKKKKKKWN